MRPAMKCLDTLLREVPPTLAPHRRKTLDAHQLAGALV
jgi:hypothetical protein